ncbi:hypothetical protein ACU6TU_09765 [Halomonas sp. LS-001]
MTPVLTNLIEIEQLDSTALARRFSVCNVSYKGWSREERNKHLAHLPGHLYRASPVLALNGVGSHNAFYLLLPVEAAQSAIFSGTAFASEVPAGDALAFQFLALDSLAAWLQLSLLIRALPRVQSLHVQPQRLARFEADGLYYVVHPDTGKGRVVTVQPEYSYSHAMKQHYLDVSTATFTRLENFRKEDGSLYADAARKPRYALDDLGEQLFRQAGGSYIKKPRYAGSKNRVDAFKLTNTSLEAYYQTRLGVLSLFLEDLHQAYAGSLKLSLQSVPMDNRSVKQGEVERHYQGLYRCLVRSPLVIVNRTQSSSVSAQLEAELLKLLTPSGNDIRVIHREDVMPDGLNLLLVDKKTYYEEHNIDDPYLTTRQAHPDAIIQSCHPQSLAKGASHTVEVLLKELLIKQEVQQRRLLLDYPSLPEDVWLIHSVKPESQSLVYNTEWPMVYARCHRGQLTFAELPQSVRESLEIHLKEEHRRQVLKGSIRADVMYWPQTGQYLMITDTEVACLPDLPRIDQWIKEIDHTRDQGIPAEIVRQFAMDYPNNPNLEALQTLLRQHPLCLPASTFDRWQNKGRANQQWFDYLAEAGYRLKAPFASAQKGALQATVGLLCNREQGIYAAAAAGSPHRDQSNFNHLYKVVSHNGPVPGWFWDSLQVWHIRHRGTTVTPYLFKHLREYGCHQQLIGKLNQTGSDNLLNEFI